MFVVTTDIHSNAIIYIFVVENHQKQCRSAIYLTQNEFNLKISYFKFVFYRHMLLSLTKVQRNLRIKKTTNIIVIYICVFGHISLYIAIFNVYNYVILWHFMLLCIVL